MRVQYHQIQIDFDTEEEFNSYSESLVLTGWQMTRKYPPRKLGEGPITIWVNRADFTPLYERVRELEMALFFLLGYEDEIIDCLMAGGVSKIPEVEQRCAEYRKMLGIKEDSTCDICHCVVQAPDTRCPTCAECWWIGRPHE